MACRMVWIVFTRWWYADVNRLSSMLPLCCWVVVGTGYFWCESCSQKYESVWLLAVVHYCYDNVASFSCSQNGCYFCVFLQFLPHEAAMLVRYWGSVRLSVCPSVTCMLCNKTKEHTADILIPYERVISLLFWHQVSDVPFHLKFAVKVTHRRLKNADFDQYLLITSQP